ncbi:MAG: CocE/NonD family hydrolase [Solirubrobacterales bacterium]
MGDGGALAGRRARRRLASGLALIGALVAVMSGPVAGAGAAGLEAHGSVEQVYATGVGARATVSLLDRRGRTIQTRRSTALGGVLFRHVRPGKGYRVRIGRQGARSGGLRVLTRRSAPPSAAIYEQSIPASGYGYLTTRDGTELAIDVHQPRGAGAGPTPTLIEYSGYGYANPAGPESGLAPIANLMGFAVVDVNMRGTGCSGGAFDYFEPLQGLDGYDVIETVARQPWVANHQVGMMGISYGGISQLFTAATRPPSLAAIAPLSVLDSTQTTLYPGGILNTGFAVPWAEERVEDAKPASAKQGQPWAYQRIREGDRTCRANQALHGEAANLLHQIRANSHYRPKVADPLAPITFVHKIDVPTFMACQWTDEQTGGHCPALAAHFTGTDRKWFTFTNGTHIDALDPATANRWFDFLELYVARQAPIANAASIRGGASLLYSQAMGVGGVSLPPDPIQEQPTYEAALAAFEAEPPVRIAFDNGAGGTAPGQPYAGFERSFPSLPVPGTEARSWFLAPGGALRPTPPAGRHADRFRWNAHALPPTDFSGDTGSGSGGLWTATPTYHWKPYPHGSSVSYLSEPLAASTTVIGAGAVKLWIRSSAPSVDLQATISEVRPDGIETFVQNGWVRGEERRLDRRKSTPLEPVLSLRRADVRPLPSGRFVPVTIPLYYEGHAYRAGSRIRVTIAAPNGTQPIWAFAETRPGGSADVAVAFSRKMPSKLLLPVVPGVSVPTGLPPCPGLRGEPCRPYRPLANLSAGS